MLSFYFQANLQQFEVHFLFTGRRSFAPPPDVSTSWSQTATQILAVLFAISFVTSQCITVCDYSSLYQITVLQATWSLLTLHTTQPREQQLLCSTTSITRWGHRIGFMKGNRWQAQAKRWANRAGNKYPLPTLCGLSNKIQNQQLL